MEIVKRTPQMKALAERLRDEGQRIGIVPTMGALHSGHMSLMQRARQMSDIVVVTIFINPIQFGPAEDLERYPRDLAADAEMCVSRGVDYIFAPLIDEVYPENFSSYVIVEGLSDRLCGASREGHFRGVTTVVSKLFNIVKPHFAFFGRKDAQQAVIIKRMVADLCMDAEIVVCPIVRDDDGLALSSRNVYLSSEERGAATVLHRALEKAQVLFGDGTRDAETLRTAMDELIASEPLVRIDYIEIVDAHDLEPVQAIEDGHPTLIALAAFVGKTRLIDNVVLNGEI
ncbi:MAG: pantoate--beta-alanine ligase [Acidobacteria bacterium]|nr:pantoate--beta-alanine ligase [Acidobacteriota bacterium]